jgi:hypothetical protein
MIKINPDYICKKVTQTEFRRSYVEFADECPCYDAALEVMANINNGLGLASDDDTGYFVAEDKRPLPDTVAIMVMSRANGCWWINDLVASRPGTGLGVTLAAYGMAFAARDYGNASNCEIQLISLNVASRRFWEKMGFAMLNPSNGGHGTMTFRIANSRPASPLVASAAVS